jgi:hypothetical protein
MIWARVKQAGKWAYLVVGLVVVGAGALIWWFLRARLPKPSDSDVLTATVRGISDRIAAGNAQAAVEIAVARTQDVAMRTQLQSTLDDTDGARRRRNLIALRKRL